MAANGYDKSLMGNVISPELPGIKKQNFLRGAAIYGANASGKSNIIRAMFELQTLVRTSHQFESGARLPHNPYLLDEESRHEATLYSIRFIAEGVRYHYDLAFDSTRVLEENLSAYPKGKQQLWYNRLWDEDSQTYHYTPKESDHFTIRPIDIEATKENSLLLSTATNLLNHPKLSPVYAWFRATLKIVNLGIDSDHLHTVETIQKMKSDSELALQLLRKADFGITGVEIEEKPLLHEKLKPQPPEPIPPAKIPIQVKIKLHHQGSEGQVYSLPFGEQSSGTQRFFDLISPFLDLIKQGQVLFLDEIETSLHPLLTRELVRMVMDPEVNTKNAQLIFATHDPMLLDNTLLRRDQIWLTEKTNTGETVLYSLMDYKSPPNNRESLVRGYLSGRYGGIPYLPESLFPKESSKLNPSTTENHGKTE